MMRTQKRWQDLNKAQKVAVVLLGILQFSLLGAALWDLRHRSEDEIRGSKGLWKAVVFVNFIGPIAYFVFGRKKTEELQLTEDTAAPNK